MKKYFSISALALLSVLCISVTLSSCDKDGKDKEDSNPIVGTWKSIDDEEDCKEIFTFSPDGSGFCSVECEPGKDPFTWLVKGNILTIILENDDYETYKFGFEVKNDKLYLYDEDENGSNVYVYNRVK